MTYDYVSGGGCDRCDGLEGRYDYPPTRPHPYCDCSITPSRTRPYEGTCSVARVVFDFHPDHPNDPEHLYTAEVVFNVVVRCLETGEVHEDTFTFTGSPDKSEEALMAEAAAACHAYKTFVGENRCIGIS